MDPITVIFMLGLANVIFEKGILPARRLMKEQVAPYDLGVLGKLGLKPEEIEELNRHVLVELGRETNRQAVINAARNGEAHVING
jgi:hypothetical protein